jgi:dTDP-glucose 4,6-dehydratase
MNLLVTGGCGFIGSNFINNYFSQCNLLINVDTLNYCADENNVNILIKTSPNYYLIKSNIQDKTKILEIYEKYRITHVIHFAAQSHVQNSFENALDFTYDNVLGTHVLLECARLYNKLELFIHISTDEVYGESLLSKDETQKNEQTILCPTNPYAATKAGAELIAQSYYHSFNMPIIITRGNNVYGPNQYPEKVIPKFIHQLLNEEKITIQGNGSNIRGFMYVNDTCNAIYHILKKGTIGEIYNIGCDPESEISIFELARLLIKKIYNDNNINNISKYISYIEDRPFNDKRYYISNDKLKKLGWTQKMNFNKGLDLLITHIEIYKLQHNNLIIDNIP